MVGRDERKGCFGMFCVLMIQLDNPKGTQGTIVHQLDDPKIHPLESSQFLVSSE